MCAAPGPDADRLFEQGAVVREQDGLFTLRGIKVVADGALGSQGAALMEDYSDRSGKGLLLWKRDDLRPLYERALREGHPDPDACDRVTGRTE